jgi:hypothetical protein
MKKMLAGVLAFAVVLLSACGDDEKAAPKSQFSFEGEDAFTLKDANLYLVYEGNDGSGHIYRDYIVTNGTYVEGNGWSFDDYTSATYIMAVELGVPAEEEELSDGNYPLYSSFSDAAESSNVSWVSFETTGDVYYEIHDDAMGEQEIEISGDYDDGDSMTIKFNGTLTNYTPEDEVSAEGKFYFKGKVEDVRSIGGPARKAASVARGALK